MKADKFTKLGCWLLAVILGLHVYPNTALGREKDLEVEVWTCHDQDLPALELEIAKHLQMQPTDSFYHYLYSYYLMRSFVVDPSDMRLLHRAVQMAEQSLILDGKADWGYFIKAQLADVVGKTTESHQTIADGFAAVGDDSWRLLFAKARLDSGAADFAADSWQIRMNPYLQALRAPKAKVDILLPFVLAIAKTTANSIDEIFARLAYLSEYQEHPLILGAKAMLHTELKEYHLADALYDQLIALKSEPEYLLNQGILRYKYLHKPKDAKLVLSRISPSAPAFLRINQMFHLALVHSELGQGQDAKRYLRKALRETANKEVLIDGYYEALYSQQRKPELKETLQVMIEEFPGIAKIHGALGELYSEDPGQEPTSLQYFHNAILLEPDNSEFYLGKGLSYYKMGDYTQALASFDRASELNPDDTTAIYNQACMLSLLGNSDKALEKLQQAIRIAPEYAKKAAKDPDFTKLYSHHGFRELVADDGKVDTGLSH